jgi:bacteriorhodopsin
MSIVSFRSLIRTLGTRNLRLKGSIVNGQRADVHITTHGSDFYWAICAAMGFATLSFLALSLRVPRPNHIFYYIAAGITMVAAITYFSMGSSLGWEPIAVEWHRSNPRVRKLPRDFLRTIYRLVHYDTIVIARLASDG